MERDFSDSTKQALISFFSNKDNLYNDDISENNLLNCQATSNVDFDIFADEIEAYTNAANNGIVFADIQLLGLISKINFVFEGAQQLDANYAGLVNKHAASIMDYYLPSLQAMVDVISVGGLGDTEAEILCNLGKKGSRGIFGGSDYCENVLSGVYSPDRLHEYVEGLQNEEAANKYINALVSSKDNVCDLSNEEKRQIIILYELYHKEYGEDLTNFIAPILENGYEKETIDIKVISYTAPEPYRTLFLENVGDMEIIDVDIDDSVPQSYVGDNKIKFDVEKWNGKYTTFFHECGHALDDMLVENGKLSLTYTKNGLHLADLLEMDVRSSISKKVTEIMNREDVPAEDRSRMRRKIVEGIMNCYDKDYVEPVFSDEKTQDIYKLVVDEVKNDNSACSSDIYGGFTGNLLQNGAWHDAIQLDKNGQIDDHYWVKGEVVCGTDGNRQFVPMKSDDGTLAYKDSLPSEYFAEHFAAKITNDPKELEGIYGNSVVENRFPQGNQLFEDMILSVCEGGN